MLAEVEIAEFSILAEPEYPYSPWNLSPWLVENGGGKQAGGRVPVGKALGAPLVVCQT